MAAVVAVATGVAPRSADAAVGPALAGSAVVDAAVAPVGGVGALQWVIDRDACLDAVENGFSDIVGGNVQLLPCHFRANQTWAIEVDPFDTAVGLVMVLNGQSRCLTAVGGLIAERDAGLKLLRCNFADPRQSWDFIPREIEGRSGYIVSNRAGQEALARAGRPGDLYVLDIGLEQREDSNFAHGSLRMVDRVPSKLRSRQLYTFTG